jgi:MoaA/NifB/PqqE/SkfB family radical SAM enzyme
MIEWRERNKYNSFNSFKGLTYYDHYQKIAGWLSGQNPLPPPIEASLDPISACNNRCYYCNSQRYLREHPPEPKRWGRDFLEDTLIELSTWGVKAFCWGGGGESLLNIRLPGMTKFGTDLGMECSIITNGVLLEGSLADELLLCRWIGISLDSANPEVYQKVRGTDDCKRVLTNVENICKKRTKTDICIKVLVLPETIDSILYTCKVAKELGVQDFHVRPVDLERKDFKTAQKLNLDMSKIQGIFDECHKLETPDFRVYTVTHKYDPEFHVKHDFTHCYASPLVMQICTDHAKYLCVDHRLEPRFEIKEWGSDQHRELMKSIVPDRDCGRCTWSEYNRQIEEVVLEDRMCRLFP